jgi:hypothetical protein
MSRKHLVSKYKMLDAVDATVSQTSTKSNVEQLDSASIHVKFSAANSGTLTVEARNGSYPAHEAEVNWYALQFGAPLTITAETDVQIVLSIMPFSEIRLKWAPSAGAGTMTSVLTMKTVGA